MRFLKAILGGALLIGGLTLAPLAASAASASQSTTLNLNVPTSITMTGLAASYTQTLNTFYEIRTGPITISTNGALGYTLKVAADAANFQGITPADVIPIADDMVKKCAPDFTSCNAGAALTTTGTTVFTTSAPSTDTFGVNHVVTVPGSQAADTYSLSVTYTATTN